MWSRAAAAKVMWQDMAQGLRGLVQHAGAPWGPALCSACECVWARGGERALNQKGPDPFRGVVTRPDNPLYHSHTDQL